VLISLLFCVACAVSLRWLRLDLDLLGMLPRGNAAFDDFRALVEDFGQLDEVVVLVEGAPMRELRSFGEVLATKLRKLDGVSRVYSRVDMQEVRREMLGRYLFNFLPEAGYDELTRRLTPEGIDAQVENDRALLDAPFDLAMAATVREDPLGIRPLVARSLAQAYGQAAPTLADGYFAAPDGSALLLFVRPRASALDIAFSRRLMAQVRAAEEATRTELSEERVRVRYTGGYVYALDDAATMRADVHRYSLLALAGVLVVFYAGYRSLRILPFVTYPLVVTTLVAFALSLLLFEQLNAVSLCFAAILYGLSIDSGIHFFTRLQQESGRGGVDAAVAATLSGLGRSNIAASGTTAIAFAIIAWSCLSAVRQLAILVALGMLFNAFLFFTLYPALALLGRGWATRVSRVMDTPRLGLVADWARRHAKAVLAFALLVGIVAVPEALRVTSDVQLMQLRPRHSDAAVVQSEIAARFGDDAWDGAVLVESGHLEQGLRRAERVGERLREYGDRGLVRAFQSVGPLMPSAHRQAERLARYAALPRQRAADLLEAALLRHGFELAPFASFLERFRAPWHEILRPGDPRFQSFAAVLDRYVRFDGRRYTVATYLRAAPGTSLALVRKQLAQDLPGVPFRLASRQLLEEELGRVLSRELGIFLALGLLANLVLLRLSLRDWGSAVAVLGPVALVVLVVLGGMGATGVMLNPVNLIVVPLILGLGVDDGVYIVGRVREGTTPRNAARHAGRALVVTSLTTIAGFGFLSLSRYPALATMGLLAGIGLLLSLVACLIVLPAILAVQRSH